MILFFQIFSRKYHVQEIDKENKEAKINFSSFFFFALKGGGSSSSSCIILKLTHTLDRSLAIGKKKAPCSPRKKNPSLRLLLKANSVSCFLRDVGGGGRREGGKRRCYHVSRAERGRVGHTTYTAKETTTTVERRRLCDSTFVAYSPFLLLLLFLSALKKRVAPPPRD